MADLAAQTADPSQYEVLVVDNAGDAETADVVAGAGSGIRLISEPRVGLAHARNRGWQAARGEYVGYLDDDCRVPPDWVAVALSIMRRIRPTGFGGPYGAWYLDEKPRWFKDAYGSSKSYGAARPLKGRREYISGGNMFFRRSALEALGGFAPWYGMNGKVLGYGEEVDFQYRLREHAPDCVIYHDPALSVRHLVAPRKFSLRWRLRAHFAAGRACCLMSDRPQYPLRETLRMATKTIGGLLRDVWGIRARERALYPYVENYICEVIGEHISRLGGLYERLKGWMRARIIGG